MDSNASNSGKAKGKPQPPPTGVSSLATPKFQISTQAFAFTILLAPVAAYYVYYNRYKQSEDELEKILSKDDTYKRQIRESQAKRRDMVNLLKSVKHGGKEETDQLAQRKMKEVLYGGKSDTTMKRLHAIDTTDKAYGTEQAKVMQERAMEEHKIKIAEQKQKRKEGRKKKRREEVNKSLKKDETIASVMHNNQNGDSNSNGRNNGKEEAGDTISASSTPAAKTIVVAAGGTIAIVAAMAILIVGGSRPRSSR